MKYRIFYSKNNACLRPRARVDSLKDLMPTQYQKDNFDAMLGLFLSAQGHPLPEHSLTKSPSALSRFLNINPWSTRDMIRIVRSHVLETVSKVLSASGKGRRPFLQVISYLRNS
ncbi:hypothetical protein [Brasilonema sp. UFV-L1]|uniref:hypothetical protein n=1 Tax=Brasilonema sp. UFV-L1 TaxID=2234130 RepID=UPI001B7D0CC3|nr:hypothetical protein [Brasilonema sp. UFV-L1]